MIGEVVFSRQEDTVRRTSNRNGSQAGPANWLSRREVLKFATATDCQPCWVKIPLTALGLAQLDVSQSLLDFATTPRAAADHLATVAKTGL